MRKERKKRWLVPQSGKVFENKTKTKSKSGFKIRARFP